MKSTVPPGTGARLAARLCAQSVGYVSNPEFLREGAAIADWDHADRIVLGGKPDAVDRVADLYSDSESEVVRTSIATAELVKYAFLATKVSFINEIAAACGLVGADVSEVAYAVGLDHRIGGTFLNAGIGCGGSCFPKDTHALGFLSSFNGYDFSMLKAVIEVNARQRLLPVKALRDRLGDLAEHRIAVLRIAFKPDTDDARESPGVDISRLLLAEGAFVTGYDPLANARIDDARFSQCDTIREALSGASAAIVATDHWTPIGLHLCLPCGNPESCSMVGMHCPASRSRRPEDATSQLADRKRARPDEDSPPCRSPSTWVAGASPPEAADAFQFAVRDAISRADITLSVCS